MIDYLKAVSHFNRIVTKRSVFHCSVNTQAELMIWTQYTNVKISQLVASLEKSRQLVVFARLVTSCQQACNLLTTCNNLVDIVRLVTGFFVTILLQPCVVNLVTFLLHHVWIRLVRTTLYSTSDNAIKLVTSC